MRYTNTLTYLLTYLLTYTNEACTDRCLSVDSHVPAVTRAYTQAIRHIRRLLTTELAVTLACSLILSRLDYCNAALHGAPAGSIPKPQRVQNTAGRFVLQAPRRTHSERLHWPPVRQRIEYKLAILTYEYAVHRHRPISVVTSNQRKLRDISALHHSYSYCRNQPPGFIAPIAPSTALHLPSETL